MRIRIMLSAVLLIALPAMANGPLSARVEIQARDHAAKVGAAPAVTVVLSCTPPAAGVTPSSYKFYRGTVSGGPYSLVGSSASCAYTDVTVTWSTQYFYVATSVATTGCPSGQVCESSFSAPTTVSTPGNPTPNPPTGLTATQTTASNILLQWNPPGGQTGYDVLAYQVFRGPSPALPAPQKIATVPEWIQSYTDAGCKGTCYYEVRPYDLLNDSTFVVGPPGNIAKAR